MISWLSLLGMPVLCWTVLAQRRPFQTPDFPIPAAGQQQTEKPVVLKMRIEQGKVTAEITDCPLQNALKELAERTGIIFEVRSQQNPLVSVQLNQVSLPEAIQRIASGSNIIFSYGRGRPGQEQITLVQIFPQVNEPPQPSILYLGTGVVTKSNEPVDTFEQALQTLTESSDVKEREKAVEVLAAVKNDAAIKALTNVLSDPAPEIRVAAIEGLAALNARTALKGILRCLKDAHPGARRSAASAVALLGGAENLKQLKPLTADHDAGVAAAAETAMRKLSAAAKK